MTLSKAALPVRPTVLVVDDVAANRELLEAYLTELGYEVREARDGVEAIEAIEANEPDLVLLDIDMPRLDGLEVCRRLKAHATRRLIPVVLITALNDRVTRLKGIEAGADEFLTKPFDAKELTVRTKVLLRERALNKRLDATEDVLRGFARAVEARDRYTIHHAERVALYSRSIGRALGLPDDLLEPLYMGAMLHDLGKIAIPDRVLLKPGPLDEEELAVMRTHAIEGEKICGSLRSVAAYLPIVRHHHERWDSQGYPDHFYREEIPLGARIAAIGDSWDAMVSDRPYRQGLSLDEARQHLAGDAGQQWEPELVEIFEQLLDGGLMRQVDPMQTIE